MKENNIRPTQATTKGIEEFCKDVEYKARVEKFKQEFAMIEPELKDAIKNDELPFDDEKWHRAFDMTLMCYCYADKPLSDAKATIGEYFLDKI